MILKLLLAAVIAGAGIPSQALLAQERGDTNSFDLFVLAGATTETNPLHGSIGGMARLVSGDWGALVLGMAGQGGDYDSLLAGAAVSRRLFGGGRWDVGAFLGGGYYREVGATGIERSAPGPVAGGLLTVTAGPVEFALVASDLIGRYSGSDVPNAFIFHVPRIAIGVGL